jgi:thiol-disulfide isomerase/thioredoxin
MSCNLSFEKRNLGTKPITLGLSLISGLVIGGYLGWMLFLAPGDQDPVLSKLDGLVTPDRQGLTVQATGTPVTHLAGAVRVGEFSPNFELLDLSGEPHALSQHRGQAVILNFWTTWCPPCRFEMPALQKMYEQYAEQGFTILGINLTESDDVELIEPYKEELGLTFPILLDFESNVSGSLYRVLGLPTSVFIDRTGIVLEVYVGAIPLEELESKVQAIMEDT